MTAKNEPIPDDSMNSTAACDARSACLSQHHAAAYLFLVRFSQ